MGAGSGSGFHQRAGVLQGAIDFRSGTLPGGLSHSGHHVRALPADRDADSVRDTRAPCAEAKSASDFLRRSGPRRTVRERAGLIQVFRAEGMTSALVMPAVSIRKYELQESAIGVVMPIFPCPRGSQQPPASPRHR